jgi:hypothetical protein
MVLTRMTPQIRLQNNQISDLRAITEIEPSVLKDAVDAVAKLPRAIQLPDKISDALEAVIGDEQPAGALLRQALAIHSALLHFGVGVDLFLAGIRQRLLMLEPPWSKEDLIRWDTNAAQLERLISLPILSLSSKTLDLSYEHPQLLQNARIITEIRPVFNEDASKIDGAVVSHNLVLQYDDLEGNHDLTLAMDEADVFSLIAQCERAVKKAQTAKEQLQNGAKIPTLIAGESDD